MYKIILVASYLLISSHTYSQDTTKPAKFAIVEMSLWGGVNWKPLKNVVSIAQYSNGLIEDLNKNLNLSPMDKTYQTTVYEQKSNPILNQDEFKILSYFYDRGYEIIYTADFKDYKKYYFKLKDKK